MPTNPIPGGEEPAEGSREVIESELARTGNPKDTTPHRKGTATPASQGATRDAGLNPGDEAQPGTPGTGENVCPQCQGSGTIGKETCPNCGGAGVVIEGIGGA